MTLTGTIPFSVQAVPHKGFEDYCVTADGMDQCFPEFFTIFGRGPSPRFVSKWRHTGTYMRRQDAATAFGRFLACQLECAYTLEKISDSDWLFHATKTVRYGLGLPRKSRTQNETARS